MKFQILLLGFFVFFMTNALAAQEAIVIADKAIVYSDKQMSSPVGFIRKGKKVKIGEIPRNLAQVYPIVVSGKVAYIRVLDVSTEKESVDAEYLTAERFSKTTEKKYKTQYSASVFSYASQTDISSRLVDQDSYNWMGVNFKGSVAILPKWDLEIHVNYLGTDESGVKFNAFEVGLGAGYRLLESRKFVARISTQLLLIPFANYAVDEDFRVNGYGLSAGTGLNLVYWLSEQWGLEGFGGLYYMKINDLKAPAPYEEIGPAFVGTRLGLGLTYQY